MNRILRRLKKERHLGGGVLPLPRWIELFATDHDRRAPRPAVLLAKRDFLLRKALAVAGRASELSAQSFASGSLAFTWLAEEATNPDPTTSAGAACRGAPHPKARLADDDGDLLGKEASATAQRRLQAEMDNLLGDVANLFGVNADQGRARSGRRVEARRRRPADLPETLHGTVTRAERLLHGGRTEEAAALLHHRFDLLVSPPERACHHARLCLRAGERGLALALVLSALLRRRATIGPGALERLLALAAAIDPTANEIDDGLRRIGAAGAMEIAPVVDLILAAASSGRDSTDPPEVFRGAFERLAPGTVAFVPADDGKAAEAVRRHLPQSPIVAVPAGNRGDPDDEDRAMATVVANAFRQAAAEILGLCDAPPIGVAVAGPLAAGLGDELAGLLAARRSQAAAGVATGAGEALIALGWGRELLGLAQSLTRRGVRVHLWGPGSVGATPARAPRRLSHATPGYRRRAEMSFEWFAKGMNLPLPWPEGAASGAATLHDTAKGVGVRVSAARGPEEGPAPDRFDLLWSAAPPDESSPAAAWCRLLAWRTMGLLAGAPDQRSRAAASSLDSAAIVGRYATRELPLALHLALRLSATPGRAAVRLHAGADASPALQALAATALVMPASTTGPGAVADEQGHSPVGRFARSRGRTVLRVRPDERLVVVVPDLEDRELAVLRGLDPGQDGSPTCRTLLYLLPGDPRISLPGTRWGAPPGMIVERAVPLALCLAAADRVVTTAAATAIAAAHMGGSVVHVDRGRPMERARVAAFPNVTSAAAA